MLKRISYLIAITLLFVSAAVAQTGSATAATPTATSSTTAKATAFRPTKDQITQGQKMLKEGKMYDGEATGVYNDATRTAVKVYQKQNGLDETGKFDRATLEKMNIALTDKQKGTATATATPSTSGSATKASMSTTTATTDGRKRPAPFQATKEQIMALQKVLKDGKMFDGEANGERSDALKESVKKYQQANTLKATGGINAETLQKAGIALTDKQKEQVAAQATYDAAKPKN